MHIIHAFLLGLTEGITEFLPVSSTGHMILLGKLLALPQTDFLTSFEIIIQLGAIAAVGVLYANTLLKKRTLWKPLFLAFVPTAIAGVVFYRVVKHYLLGNAFVVVASLAAGGILFLIMEMHLKKRRSSGVSLESVSSMQAITIGIGQSFSLIPGVSRAAATMFTGMLTGLSREAAVEFSFLLAIPTMIAAVGLDLIKSPFVPDGSSLALLLAGLFVSFATALVAVKTFLRYIRSHSFFPFALYRILLAIVYYWFILR